MPSSGENDAKNGGPSPSTTNWLEWLASNTVLPFLCSQLVNVPSALLYATEIAVICWALAMKRGQHSARFNTPFHKLFLARAVNVSDFLLSLLNTVLLNIPRLGVFLELYKAAPSVLWNVAKFQGLVCLSAGNIATAVISLNRFTAVAIPLKHNAFWNRALRPSILVIFILPMFYNIHYLLWTRWFVHVQPDGTFTIDNYNRLEHSEIVNPLLVTATSSGTFMLVSLVLNIGTLYFYRQTTRRYPSGLASDLNSVHQQNDQISRKLLAYAVATFLAHFAETLYIVLMFVVSCSALTPILISQEASEKAFFFLANISPIVIDGCIIVFPAWLFVWASSEIRTIIFGRAIKLWQRINILGLPTLSHVTPLNNAF